MSYTEVYRFRKDTGRVVLAGEARNSWGFAMAIWMRLSDEYGLPFDPTLLMMAGVSGEEVKFPLWDLFRTSQLSEDDQIVLGATFDWVIVKSQDIPKLVSALRAFSARHQDLGTIVELIAILESEAENVVTEAIGFNATSVNGDAWRMNYRPYNLHKHKKHWDLFEEIKRYRSTVEV